MVIHTDKLRWLFWLRWKTLMRGYTRRPLSIIGALFVLLFIVLVAGTLAVVSFFAYRLLPSPANSEVLYLILTAALLVWIVLPATSTPIWISCARRSCSSWTQALTRGCSFSTNSCMSSFYISEYGLRVVANCRNQQV